MKSALVIGALAIAVAACAPVYGDAYLDAMSAAQREQREGRFDAAIPHFEEAIRAALRVKDRDEAQFSLARVLMKAGKRERAEEVLREIARQSPRGPRATRAQIELARLEIEHHNPQRGHEMLLDAIHDNPNHGVSRFAFYEVLEREKAKGEPALQKWLLSQRGPFAGTDLEQTVDYERARSMDRAGDHAGAEKLFLETARRFPYPIGSLTDDALFRAALCAEKRERFQDAVAHLREMLSVREISGTPGSYERPQYLPARVKIAELFRDKLDNRGAARAELWALHDEHTTTIVRDDALWEIARLAKEDGLADEACKATEKLVDEFPESRYVPCGHLVCSRLGSTDKACRGYIERALGDHQPLFASDAIPGRMTTP